MFGLGTGRGMGRMGATGGTPSLAAQISAMFAQSPQGAWYDPSDFSTLFQDSAGTTPVTVVQQALGRVNDKSGRGNNATQATAASRSILRQDVGGSYYLEFDGIDDGLTTGPMTFSANMDFFIAVRRATTAMVVLAAAGATSPAYFGVLAGGDFSVADADSGSPTYAVNGVSVNGGAVGTTRDQLHTATPVNTWHVVEIRNLNLSSANWNALSIGNYSSFMLTGDIGGIILWPAGTDATRTNNRKFLGNKVGLSL